MESLAEHAATDFMENGVANGFSKFVGYCLVLLEWTRMFFSRFHVAPLDCFGVYFL